MSSKNVLVIDDVDDMREMLGALIDQIQGLKTSGLAANGWDARLEVDRRCPDVILLDEVLPGESSLDLLKEFHERGIPVVLISSVQDASRPLPDGAFARLTKPEWETMEQDRNHIAQVILKAVDGPGRNR